MKFPEMRNNKGEDIAKATAEMMKLAKLPGMKPYLTSTARKREEAEEKKKAAEEAERKRLEEIEFARREECEGKWFDYHMRELAPHTWAQFMKKHDQTLLLKAGYELIADRGTSVKPGHLPCATTVCEIKRHGKIKKTERLVWTQPVPIPSRIVDKDGKQMVSSIEEKMKDPNFIAKVKRQIKNILRRF